MDPQISESNCMHTETEIYGDNQWATLMAKNPVRHTRTKHIDIRYHFVCVGVQDGTIALRYIATDEMIADILTKPLPNHCFEKLVTKLRMKTVKQATSKV